VSQSQPLLGLVNEFSRRPDISPKTRLFYRDQLTRQFLPWAQANGITAPEQLVPSTVTDYALHLEARRTKAGQPLSRASCRTYLKALQQWMGWLQKRKGVEGIDSTQVPLPPLRRQQREVLSRLELQTLEDAAPTERNKLLIRLMADTGAREGEVVSMKREDLIERGRVHYVRLRGKTGERMIPIQPSLYRRLRAYAEGKSGRPRSAQPRLFLSERRRPQGEHEPLTENGVYQAFRDAVTRSGLERRVYPHLLRHSAITAMVVKGMHPALVSDITGVSVQVIASHYSHPTLEQRHEAMMRVLDA